MLHNEECAMLSENIQLNMTETSLGPESPPRLFLFWQLLLSPGQPPSQPFYKSF